MGNGQYVSVLFVIPVIIEIQGHKFEILTLVSEIHDNVDLVMGMKNIFEVEGVIDSQDSCVSFRSRSIPYSPVTAVEIAPKIQKMVVIEASFIKKTIRTGHSKDFGHKRTSNEHDHTEIH